MSSTPTKKNMANETTSQEKKGGARKSSKTRGNSASEVLGQVESLMTVVNQAAEGEWDQEMPVSGDNAVGHLADGLQALLSDFSAAKTDLTDFRGQVEALGKSNAVIEFELDGTIRDANANFCGAVGYTLDEIKGQHHRIFVDPKEAATPEYRQFWQQLGQGEFKSGEFKRVDKNGNVIWIQASYNPVFDESGKPFKVVKYASDITAAKSEALRLDGKLDAINQTQAVIEFTPEGEILDANENFCGAMGYSIEEIRGKHHRMFVDREYAGSPEYRRFWEELGRGDAQAGQFERYGKSGDLIVINAIYTPVRDLEGNVARVIKLATDVTEEARTSQENARIRAMMEHAPAMVFADREFRLQYMNPVAERVLKSLEEYLPIKVEDMIGQTMDIFHKNPAHQRGILSDPSRLPMTSQISIGPETIDMIISPVHDPDRNHIGTMVTMENVTKKLELEREIEEKREAERVLQEETQRKVETVLGVVNNIAAGRFDVEFPNIGSDGIGQVATALSTAVSAVRDALTEVRDVSGTVAAASTQMSSAAEEISRGAQQQAARLEETASSLEEITTTVKQNSENAQEARNLANNSRDIATKGGTVVGDAVEAMAEINNSSKKISDIITTIDEIAFQTNLLALNAAVEAARAGEQGRGFAVVASEVRNLAQRSASSAKEIKTLIQDSASKVETGTSLVNKSGETLGEIVDSVKRVTDIVAEIAAASQEQLTAIEQVNTAVTQMDHVTQANASQTE
ncbi:MAG: methyl-accepting chemotaxis protein, partial [Planctomycetota bacterium]